MTDKAQAEREALEAYPPTYIRPTWVRQLPDINAPLRAAYVAGYLKAKQPTKHTDK